MDKPSTSTDDFNDPDLFTNVKEMIEKELSKMKKIVNNINQMRVEAAYLESDLLLVVDSSAWEEISELVRPAPTTYEDTWSST